MSDSALRVALFGRTDQGRRRKENQDSMLIGDFASGFVLDANPAPGTPTVELEPGAAGLVMLVADGMGGAAGGATASRLAISAVETALETTAQQGAPDNEREFAAALSRALEAANEKVFDAARRDPSLSGMGTTSTLAGIFDGAVYVAQVGDSRAYIIRDGAAVQVTRDQSFVQELIDAGAMTEEQAEVSEHANKIMQAIGVGPTVKPVLTRNELRSGDVILLCSDGLSRVVKREEIESAVTQWRDPAELCTQLIDLANERGGPDNITVLIARVDLAGAATSNGALVRTNFPLH